MLFNNTTDIHPHVHSTDTHGTNQVNFALLHIFGYQFAPHYKAIQFYNMTLLSELWARKEATQDMTRIAHISPVAWQHINFYGRYDFTKASEPINMEEMVEAIAHHPLLSMLDEGDA